MALALRYPLTPLNLLLLEMWSWQLKQETNILPNFVVSTALCLSVCSELAETDETSEIYES